MVPFRFQLRVGAVVGTFIVLLLFVCISWGIYLNRNINSNLHSKHEHFNQIPPRIQLPLEQSRAKYLTENTVVLTSINSGFLDIAINWLESIKKLGINPNIILVAEDEEAFEKLRPYNDSSTCIRKGGLVQSTNTSKLIYDTPEYRKLVYRRPKYIYDELHKGNNVFFCDVDTFWLKDPFPYFNGDYDVILQRDVYFRPHVPVRYCAGMVYFRSSVQVKAFVKKWIELTLNERLDSKKNDQTIMNSLLSSHPFLGTLKRKVLNSEEFPNGQLYFNDTIPTDRHKAVVVHNNWVIGHDIKVDRFKKAGLWLVDDLQR